MRILFWSELFWPYIGGVELSGTALLTALRPRGYDFIVVTAHDYLDLPDEDRHEGIQVFRLPFRKVLAQRRLDQVSEVRKRLSAIKRAFAPELVHVNSSGPSILFFLETAQVSPAPLVVTLRSGLGNTTLERDTIMGRVLRRSSWVTSVSASLLNDVQRQVSDIIGKSSVVPDGVQMAADRFPEPLSMEAPRVLCLGRLVTDKGFDLALTAFASIRDRFPNARLILAGDGPARGSLERQAAGLNLTGSVTFLGIVSPARVAELLHSASLVLMPSRREGLPRVALEAALMARPVVAARVGGLGEIIRHGETGWLIDPEDTGGLVKAAISVLEDPDAAARMGRNARNWVQTTFSWERCVDAYDRLYQKLGKSVSAVA